MVDEVTAVNMAANRQRHAFLATRVLLREQYNFSLLQFL